PRGRTDRVQRGRGLTGSPPDPFTRARPEPLVEHVHSGDLEAPHVGSNTLDDAVTDVQLPRICVVPDGFGVCRDGCDGRRPDDLRTARHATARPLLVAEPLSVGLYPEQLSP